MSNDSCCGRGIRTPARMPMLPRRVEGRFDVSRPAPPSASGPTYIKLPKAR